MHALILPEIAVPVEGERPTVFSDRIGRAYSRATSVSHKKKLGQYLTPIAVADFMASLVECDRNELRILDPGAGTGVLACALAESIVRRNLPAQHLTIDACESDPELLPLLDQSLSYLSTELGQNGISVSYRAVATDFVLEHAAELRRDESLFRNSSNRQEYDIVVGNPPYFKLSKSDPRAKAASHVVHGQPNIYALFLATSAALLASDGQMVFITPRSFTSGPYFRRFREQFFTQVRLEALHVFDSRRDAFERDGVLQENVILKARRRENRAQADSETLVKVSTSHGTADIATCEVRAVRLSDLLDMTTKEKMLRIPSSETEYHLIDQIDRWSGSLQSYGMQVSTGPVVPFRAVELLSVDGKVPEQHAPLLWLQNVRPMRVEWPTSARRKPQYISTTSRNAFPLLVRDRNYVVLRRFSAKEERRRLVAAPLIKGQFGCEWIGIENHLNYIHRPGGTLTEEEAFGLAVLYNSNFMDTYFRILNGSTQVSATEIRKIPLPTLDVIVEIGRLAKRGELDLVKIDELAQLVFSAGRCPAQESWTQKS